MFSADEDGLGLDALKSLAQSKARAVAQRGKSLSVSLKIDQTHRVARAKASFRKQP